MARLKGEKTHQLELLEGELGCLGNARIYLRLINERVRMAAINAEPLLSPALGDLMEIDRLILTVQRMISERIRMMRSQD